jgi:hypothetical protein
MAGKRRKLSGKILIDYFGQERLGLNRHVVDSVLEDINKPIRGWKDLLKIIETMYFMSRKISEIQMQDGQEHHMAGHYLNDDSNQTPG